MNKLLVLCALLVCVVGTIDAELGGPKKVPSQQPASGAAVDEVVVESSLYIKKKPQLRRTRSVATPLKTVSYESVRVKRQKHRSHSSESSANAASQSNFFDKSGRRFGASAANAQAQGFETNGALGSFGASAAGTQTQSFTAGRGAVQGSTGASMSQVYRLPNGKTLNLALSNSFSAGSNGVAGSRSNAINIS